MSIKKTVFKNTISLFCLIFIITHVAGQTRISSPYSSFGIGDISFTNYRPNSGMGGLSLAFRDPAYVNYLNPASYTSLDTLSFVFQTGIQSDFAKLTTSSVSQNSNYTSFSYLIFGFPITRWWKSSLGFIPYSNMGYKISETDQVANIGHVNYLFNGSGGFKELYFGNAFRINKNLSLGFNAAYMFGTIERNQDVQMTDTIHYYYLQQQEKITPSDFCFNFGLQYVAHLKKNLSLTIGGTYANATILKAKRQVLSARYIQTSTVSSIIDTIENSGNIKGSIKIPQYYGIGFILSKQYKWLVGADLQMQKWSQFKSFDKNDSLTDSWRLSAGAEIIPDNSSTSGYFQKMHYRIGAHYSKTNIKLNNTQINDIGVTAGIVFPFKRTKTNISMSIDLGQMGTTDKFLIKEEYARLILCLNLYDRWFFKRRYE